MEAAIDRKDFFDFITRIHDLDEYARSWRLLLIRDFWPNDQSFFYMHKISLGFILST